MNSPLEKENVSVDLPETPHNLQPTTKLTEMTSKAVEEISHKIEEVFSKLQRNMEHNTRIFQEKSQGLLNKIDQAEDQLRKVLLQLETSVTGKSKPHQGQGQTEQSCTVEEFPVVPATESIALSEESTKLEADDTTEN